MDKDSMKSNFSEATDGRKLLHIQVPLQSPDAAAPVVRVTFELFHPKDWSISASTYGLLPLSTVRTDTFEPVTLSPEQFREVMVQALELAATYDPDW
jgi:hypothetical protein